MDIKEILKDYISYNWIEELITDKQKEDLEGQLDLYINGNSLLNLCGVTQQSELCEGNCGMNYCDENGCVDNKPDVGEPKPPEHCG